MHPSHLRAPAVAAALCALAFFQLPALAHGDGAHGVEPAPAYDAAKVKDTPFGRQGDPKQVTRSLIVDMSEMRFAPAVINVKRGETVRLNVRNKGQVLHELVLGTPEDFKQHAAAMRAMPGMVHAAPQMVHVEPGHHGEIVWQFTQAGEIAFACLLPGHFEAGMVGKVVVR
ncbi:cupredoxin domain-containing protein [Rubrivivax gelatinosus]|uniref:Blue (type 1) copper domain-containing protein n=1 Tax=Rubrivivax gelatinosus TaxID=28068 RepID=A0ABS1E0G0_RUBGE|nr:cupredoxin family protein [Rubrivivax gelatinosus]MBK1714935.1 hypothetical protein [Rubrivivax gelatinosus]